MYTHNVEFVFEHMVIITDVWSLQPDVSDETIIDMAKDSLIKYYKIDPEVLYLQDVILHRGD
jgi:hypothetical protein